MWRVPNVVLVGYGRTQIMKYQCAKCCTEFIPASKTSYLCDNCVDDEESARYVETLQVSEREHYRIVGRRQTSTQSTRRSQKNYALTYRRDDWTCQYCGYRPSFDRFVPLSIDHIYPFSAGGSYCASNLVVACVDCNGIAGAMIFRGFEDKKRFILKRRGRKNLPIYNKHLKPNLDKTTDCPEVARNGPTSYSHALSHPNRPMTHCPACGALFEPRSKNQRFCRKRCRDTYHNEQRRRAMATMQAAGVQLDLFATQIIDTPIPASRRADPESSRIAERGAGITGQRKRVAAAMEFEENITALELAVKHCMDRYMVSRRLPELEKLGFVARHPSLRRCRICGRPTTTWKGVQDG